MTDRERVLADLRERGLHDTGQLTEAERAAVEVAIDRLAAHGGRVAVVVLPPDEELVAWRSLWADLGFDADRDLLLLHDGERWEAKGLGLSSAVVSAELRGAAPALARGRGAGLADALERLGRASGRVPIAVVDETSSSTWILGGGLVGAFALGGLGWILARRMRRAEEEDAELREARAEVERLVGEVVLDADALGADGRELQDRAMRLKAEVGRIPADLPSNQRLGRVRTLQDEAVALGSRILQARRREG